MINFSNFYSFTDFMKMYSLIYIKEDNVSNHNFIKESQNCRFKITIAAINFLRENIKQNNIEAKNVTYHNTNSIKLWNKIISFEDFVPNASEYRNSFGALIYSFYKTEFKDNPKLFYEFLCNKITTGDIGDWDFQSMEKCLDCGKQISIRFNKWIPQLDLLNETEDINTNCLEFINKEINIKFLTSEILISDWFNIDEFYDIIDNPKFIDGSENGNLLEIEYLLKNFNFISINVGNEDHKIILSDKYIFCGVIKKYNQKTFKLNKQITLQNINYIGTNSKVTIIETQQLINILSLRYNKEEAINLVEEFLKNNLVKKINITPGNYKLHYNSSPENFRKNFKHKITSFKPTFYLEKIVDF